MEDLRSRTRALLVALAELHEAGDFHGSIKPSSFKASAQGTLHIDVASNSDELWNSPAHQRPDDKQAAENESIFYIAPELCVHGVANVLRLDLDKSGRRRGEALDVWSVGCIVAELVRDSPLFSAASTEFELLSLHCDALGYRFADENLEIVSPFDVATADNDNDNARERPTLRSLLENNHVCEHFMELLERLLCSDWQARISASQALDLAFLSQCSCAAELGQDAGGPLVCACGSGDGLCADSDPRCVSYLASDAASLHPSPQPAGADSTAHGGRESYTSFLSALKGSTRDDASCSMPELAQGLVQLVQQRRKRKNWLDEELDYEDDDSSPDGPEDNGVTKRFCGPNHWSYARPFGPSLSPCE